MRPSSPPDDIRCSHADRCGRRVLILGYRTGLQMWDCTDLGSISEILNLSGAQWADVQQAQILPTPSMASDALSEPHPFLGILYVLIRPLSTYFC